MLGGQSEEAKMYWRHRYRTLCTQRIRTVGGYSGWLTVMKIRINNIGR